jgi:hypothetical protein
MAARIFISYRTGDGADKATALARDLGQVFGSDAVFLDKEDLPGGSAWRQEIGRTLQQQPVLLLLLTPQLIEATGPDGRLRIADADDPVRREVELALEASAHLIPVLCDGLQGPPDATRLPAPFNRIGELTWRKLRAYDWAHDVERLVVDLVALGVPRVAGDPAAASATTTPAPAPAAAAPTRRWVATGLVAATLAVAAAASLSWWWSDRTPDAPAPAAGIGQNLAGRWLATLSRGERVVAVFTQAGDRLTLATEPIPIASRTDWADYRKFWRERFASDLDSVMYRGEGLLLTDPGQPARIDIALKVHAVPDSGEPVDGGNLSATLSADGAQLSGTLWLNGEQSSQPALLQRERQP